MRQTWTRENFARLETLYHSANGYLGVRAAPEEGAADGVDSIRGTYLNAFYELKDVRYGEKLFGFPETQQVMVKHVSSLKFLHVDLLVSVVSF